MFNKQTIKRLQEKFKTFTSSNINTSYNNIIDLTETDSDEELTNQNNEIKASNKKRFNEVYYRGVCELKSKEQEFDKIKICCYNIIFYNKFPILLFLFQINSNNEIDFLNYSGLSSDIIKNIKKDYALREIKEAGIYNNETLFLNINDPVLNMKLKSFIWVTPREILDEKSVFHFKFHENVKSLFKNTKLLYLENEKKETYDNLPTGYLLNTNPLERTFGPITNRSKIGYTYQKTSEKHTENVSRALLFIKSNNKSTEITINNLNQQMPLAFL